MLVGVCFSTGDHKDSPQCLGTLGNLDLFFLLIRTFSLDPLDHPHCDLPPRSPPVPPVQFLLFCSLHDLKDNFTFINCHYS